MIDVKELRIGNWVGTAGGTKPKIITVEDFWSYYVDPMTRFHYYDPIPLSAEILEAAGFEKKYVAGDIRLHWLIDGLLFCEDELSMSRGLHWLQNYIYFKTGKELDIKL